MNYLFGEYLVLTIIKGHSFPSLVRGDCLKKINLAWSEELYLWRYEVLRVTEILITISTMPFRSEIFIIFALFAKIKLQTAPFWRLYASQTDLHYDSCLAFISGQNIALSATLGSLKTLHFRAAHCLMTKKGIDKRKGEDLMKGNAISVS